MAEHYLITGATGYVGSMFIKELYNTDAEITAIVRDREKAVRMLGEGTDLLIGDITDKRFMDSITGSFDYILHFAAVTKSAEMVEHPVETLNGIVTGTGNILEIAGRSDVKSMVYISSMEVYGDLDCSDGHRAKEEEIGYIDPFNVRSCYPMGKRMAEHLCFLYHKQYGVPVKIARLAQTFGKGILPGENRIFAQFAQSVIEKKDLVLHTRGLSYGNYCGISDVLRALKLVLLRGKDGEAYNIVNEDNTMRICDMAEMVAHDIAEDQIKAVFDIDGENRGYASDTSLMMSGEKMRRLGFEAEISLKDMYVEMIEYLKDRRKSHVR